MPWQASTIMSLKLSFVRQYLAHQGCMSSLCAVYGISRKTGYKWVKRFEEQGHLGLEDTRKGRSGRPSIFTEHTWDHLLSLRAEHPTFGPRKLRVLFTKLYPGKPTPSISLIKQWLREAGLSSRHCPQPDFSSTRLPLSLMTTTNSVWCVDFKGWVKTKDQKRLEPLTLMDGHSRYLLLCIPVPRRTTEVVKPLLERAFSENGKPVAIRSDNGPPFGSNGYAGLSRLSIWLLTHGIWPEKIQPGHPEQNGRLERLHRTLKKDALSGECQNFDSYELRLHEFQRIYNEVRPHEALGDLPPARVYKKSPREYKPDAKPEYEYPPATTFYKVNGQGYISIDGTKIYLSESLQNQVVGVGPKEEKGQPISFLGYPLGYVEQHRLRSKKTGSKKP